jgi:hypothetical protein
MPYILEIKQEDNGHWRSIIAAYIPTFLRRYYLRNNTINYPRFVHLMFKLKCRGLSLLTAS